MHCSSELAGREVQRRRRIFGAPFVVRGWLALATSNGPCSHVLNLVRVSIVARSVHLSGHGALGKLGMWLETQSSDFTAV